MSKEKKLIIIALSIVGGIAFLIIITAVVIFLIADKEEPAETLPVVEEAKEVVVFTHQMFDPAKVAYITPLGELNGGYIEVQTVGGVMIDLADSLVASGEEMEVYAPTDMELTSYAHYTMSNDGSRDWSLEFRVNEDVTMLFGHITNASQKVIDVVGNTPKVDDSSTTMLSNPIQFKAGEVIGTTKGASGGANWNIYMYDTNTTNTFINQKRYEANYMGQNLINASCPFDYYEDEGIKSAFYALLGATASGQTSECGSPSKDVAGTLSGMWHLQTEGIESEYEGQYANPFSIYKRSGGNIIIYEMGKKRHIVSEGNSTYKDPAEITTEHCYQLTDNWNASQKSGYAYFKLTSDTEMLALYKNNGTCPATFPKGNAKKYYR